jgi:hypothetical protein
VLDIQTRHLLQPDLVLEDVSQDHARKTVHYILIPLIFGTSMVSACNCMYLCRQIARYQGSVTGAEPCLYSHTLSLTATHNFGKSGKVGLSNPEICTSVGDY